MSSTSTARNVSNNTNITTNDNKNTSPSSPTPSSLEKTFSPLGASKTGSTNRSSMRNFLKFNGGGASSSDKQSSPQQPRNPKDDGSRTNDTNQNNDSHSKRNGYIQTTTSSSPLIGRNYPHHRVSKSPSTESSSSAHTNNTASSTKSSPPSQLLSNNNNNNNINNSSNNINNNQLINTNNKNNPGGGLTSVINLHPVNHHLSKQNSFGTEATASTSKSTSANFRHSFRTSSGSNLFTHQQTTSQNYANHQVVLQQQQQQQQRPGSSLSLSNGSKMILRTSNPQLYDNVPSQVAAAETPNSPQTSPQQPQRSKNSPRFERKHFLRNSSNLLSVGSPSPPSSSMQQAQYGQIINCSKSKTPPNIVAAGRKEDEKKEEESTVEDRLQSKLQQQFQWIEIMEPKSRTKMFANLNTGECRWVEPKGVTILRQSDPNLTQWWELYDQKTQRFYYYSVKDSITIWQKPTSSDAIVVPLARLQIIKQNINNNGQAQSTDQPPMFDRFIPSAGSNSSGGQITSSPSSPSLSSPNCLRCKFNNAKQMVDSSTQTFSIAPEIIRRPSKVSRWTQTTIQTPVNVRLGLINRNDGNHQKFRSPHQPPMPSAHHQQPSLKHYLLSEARFAARGQTLADNRIYDPISEGIYDPVAQENYCPIYRNNPGGVADEDDEIIINGDDYYHEDDDNEEFDFDDYDESDDFSCDADDEFGDNSYSEDDDVDDDDDDDDYENDYLDDREDENGNSEIHKSHRNTGNNDGETESELELDYSSVDGSNHQMRTGRLPEIPLQKQQIIGTNNNNHFYADYDTVDYDDYIRMASNHQTSLITNNKHQQPTPATVITKKQTSPQNQPHPPPSALSSSSMVTAAIQQQQQNNLDGLRMSASFTASDFKRNALGRSSYTPSMQHHYPHAAQHQQQQSQSHPQQPSLKQTSPSHYLASNLPKDAYSNPFNNTGSLRSSTSRISSTSGGGGIADRIQLFNQKSIQIGLNQSSIGRGNQQPISPPKTPFADSPRSSLLHSSEEKNGAGQIQRFLHQQQQQLQKSSSSQLANVHQSQATAPQLQPSKSTSMTQISPPQQQHTQSMQAQQSDMEIMVGMHQQQQKMQPNNIQISSMQKRSSLAGKFPNTGPSNHSFDVAELGRNFVNVSASGSEILSPVHGKALSFSSSTPVSNQSQQQQAPFQLHFNDAHMVMLNKSQSIKNKENNGVGKPKQHPKDAKKNGESQNKKQPGHKDAIMKQPASSNGKSTKLKSNKNGANNKENKSMKQAANSSNNANNSIESFAKECVSRHRKGGIFSKKKTLKSMLIHTKKPLKKPMISTISDSLLVKESVTCFKMIQIFMGDRMISPASSTSNIHSASINNGHHHQESATVARISPIPKSDEQLLIRLLNVCVQLVPLRDEVLVQVARQVTQNPLAESERRGLELMCTLFWYFTASNKLAQHLHAFLSGHRNQFTMVVRRKFEQQMQRSRHTHSHLFYRKPHSADEVARVLRCVRAQHVGVFGETLADAVQDKTVTVNDDKNSSMLRNLPWPVVLLTEALLEPRHEDREGVFRCVGDMDDVHRLKMKLDTILPTDRYFEDMIGRNSGGLVKKLTDDHDIHVIASTLKLYFRELRESIIPVEMYFEALDCAHDPQRACLLLDKLPALNRATLFYLIRFLQIFSTNDHVRDTKMDDANLSMVWAPNILRSPLTSQQTAATTGGPLVSGSKAANLNALNSANIYEQTRAEMSLVRTLIQHLDTHRNTN